MIGRSKQTWVAVARSVIRDGPDSKENLSQELVHELLIAGYELASGLLRYLCRDCERL